MGVHPAQVLGMQARLVTRARTGPTGRIRPGHGAVATIGLLPQGGKHRAPGRRAPAQHPGWHSPDATRAAAPRQAHRRRPVQARPLE